MVKLLIIALAVGALFGAKMEISKDATCLIRKSSLSSTQNGQQQFKSEVAKPSTFQAQKVCLNFYFEPSRWREYQVKQNDDMRINVTDYETLEKIPAREAFYVYGSQKTSPAGDDLPAFASKRKAEKFAKKYEGRRVLDFSQVSDGLINLLNNRLR